MIARLAGVLDAVDEDGVVLDVQGVGYLVFCSARTMRALPQRGSAVRLFIETHVREDHIHLYGFVDESERDWFRLLTTVQGVGARIALSILGAVEAAQLGPAIAAQDKAALSQADGVGPKLAARIVNELRDKVPALTPALAPAGAARAGRGAAAGGAGVAEDAVSALVNLGYRRTEAFTAVADAARRLGPEAGLDALIRAGLQGLGR